MVEKSKLYPRDIYLNKLISFKDSEVVKIVTGIRRCGKSSLLKLMAEYLKNSGVQDNRIIEMNLESFEFRNSDVTAIYNYVKDRIIPDVKMYLFFDELQRVDKWEDAINAFRVDFDCDIYITGSNAYLLSSEYSTYLSGRCVEIKMLPLSFSEYIIFKDMHVAADSTGKMQIYDAENRFCDRTSLFNSYLRTGGLPSAVLSGDNFEMSMTIFDGIYSTVVVRDILERENRRGQRKITDSFLLKKIILFLADSIGSNISVSSIGNILVNEKLLEDYSKKTMPSAHTVQAYVDALLESYFFYEIKRFDIKGKEYLRTLGKYYIVDIGLRNYLLGLRDRDTGHILENVVYLELLRRGYDVAIGKHGNLEIDFIAQKYNEKKYIQVTQTMFAEETRTRELEPLQKIKDNYEKTVISLDTGFDDNYGGINSVNIIDWLLK